MTEPLTLVISKGRLFDQVSTYAEARGLKFVFEDRKLVAVDETGMLKIILVKNADLPTYVRYGIAGLGICGDDVLYEYGDDLLKLMELPFGSTTMSLAGFPEQAKHGWGPLTVATKFTRFTHDYFHEQGTSVKLIRLDGSVELAPVLGLAPYIVDLVETGSTLKAHGLVVLKELKKITVHLVANRAYYKWHYEAIRSLIARLKPVDDSTGGRL